MYQSSNKQPPSIIYSTLNSENFVMALISSNGYIFSMPLGSVWDHAALYRLYFWMAPENNQ